jgi:hypothetical protein
MGDKTEKIIYSVAFYLAAGLLFFGFDEAAMAIFGILMLVYGVKSIKERNAARAVLLLAVGALLVGVAIYERFK